MTTPKQMIELADELERAQALYLNQFGISPNHEIKRGKLAQLLWDDKQTFIEALRLAAIQPQQIREALESARDYIASVNFYAAGTPAYIKNCEQLIKIDAALAHTRPECGCICQNQHRRGYCTEPGCPFASQGQNGTENKQEGQS